MLTIRLQRKGKKNQPFFKIVVTEKEKSSTRGRFVEELGFYNPLTKEKSLKGDRAKYWMSVGAKPSDTVYNMLVAEGIVEGKKRPKHKTPKQSAAADVTGQESKKQPEPTPEAPKEAPAEQTPHSKEQPKAQEQAPKPTPEEPKDQEMPALFSNQ